MGNELAVSMRYAVALAGRYPLLAGADLDVRTGEIVVLKGANGAGKTSLLLAVAGLLPLSAGEATVLGLDPSADARVLRRQVGLLGHANALYDDLTAEENVRFAARAARLPREAASQALERLGLTDRLLSLPARRLSAGQRRRVALAALLARQPRLWLLDEPHAGLDAEHRQLLDGLLKEVTLAGATVIAASHEDRTSAVLAGRVVTMSGGTVLDGLLSGPGAAPVAGSGVAPVTGAGLVLQDADGRPPDAAPEEVPSAV
jgi:heme ABC exporter ATP-binding subunit CcmA